LRNSVRRALGNPELSVIIVRGNCSVRVPISSQPRTIDAERCDQCGTCLLLGCLAIQKEDGRVFIDATLCVGDACTVCQQLCPRQAVAAQTDISGEEKR